MIEPLYEYGHDLGRAVTGGYVWLSDSLPELMGRYIFGDYVSGRIWALKLPPSWVASPDIVTLGRWKIFPATFGRDAKGRVYVADHLRGTVFRLAPAPPSTPQKDTSETPPSTQ